MLLQVEPLGLFGPALGPFLWNMASSYQNRSLSDFYFGGCSSPRNQPTASDFIGSSDGMAICSTCSHSEQSNVRSSNPVGPGEVRASFMRARHFGQRSCWIANSGIAA